MYNNEVIFFTFSPDGALTTALFLVLYTLAIPVAIESVNIPPVNFFVSDKTSLNWHGGDDKRKYCAICNFSSGLIY